MERNLQGILRGINRIGYLGLIFLAAIVNTNASEEPTPDPQPSPQTSIDSRPQTQFLEGDTLPKKRKRSVTREKEAEGTQAPNRFDADLILKSKYEINGQALEVDPD